MKADHYTVVHLATTNTGGAGIAAWRQHLALRAAGIDSRFLCAHARAETLSATCAVCPPVSIPVWKRALSRALHLDDAVASDEAALASVARAAGAELDYELFSSPRSRYAPERHPWVKGGIL